MQFRVEEGKLSVLGRPIRSPSEWMSIVSDASRSMMHLALEGKGQIEIRPLPDYPVDALLLSPDKCLQIENLVALEQGSHLNVFRSDPSWEAVFEK